MSTNYVNRVALHATAETSLPSLAALGSNIAQSTWNSASWVTLGSVTRDGDDANLASDNIPRPFLEEEGNIQAPRDPAPDETVIFQDGAAEFDIKLYDVAQAVHDLDSRGASDGVVWEKGGPVIYRSVAVEVAGLLIDYYPKCRVKVVENSGGYTSEPGMITLRIKPHKTSSIPSGHQRHYYS